MIKQVFKGEWVELTDVKWDSARPYPREARVRRHSSLRSALMTEIKSEGRSDSSPIFYLGGVESLVEHDAWN